MPEDSKDETVWVLHSVTDGPFFLLKEGGAVPIKPIGFTEIWIQKRRDELFPEVKK